jgi:hypothetical protein
MPQKRYSKRRNDVDGENEKELFFHPSKLIKAASERTVCLCCSI